MTERARGIGGELSVASELGTGTIIDLTVPREPAR
jgi:signal transduction histidine kinase